MSTLCGLELNYQKDLFDQSCICTLTIYILSNIFSFTAWGWGDPHITTLDDRTYTFNGWGEYTLLEPASNKTQFVLQGRTAPVNESVSNSATQFSAFAFGIPEEVSFQVNYTIFTTLTHSMKIS